MERRCSLDLEQLRMRPLWPRRQALSKCLRSLVMWLRRSLELNAATRVAWNVAPIGTRVVRSVVSIAMSVERYADTATEFITKNRILLAAKTKDAPPAHPRSGRSFGLCDSSIDTVMVGQPHRGTGGTRAPDAIHWS